MNENLKISDIPKSERPQEKLIRLGSSALSNHELLALILRTGTSKENVLGLSMRILQELDGINGLLNTSHSELMKISGIKEVKAAQIMALCELFKRFKSFKSGEEFKISDPKSAAMIVMNEISSLRQEVLMLMMLNTKNIIISIKEVFKGSLNSSIVHPREIFVEAIKKSAASIIICHNHPSGDPTPSKEDVNITLRIKECGKIVGIDLLDHIIIGGKDFISLKEQGII
ncbi:RadC family protein [Clostridium manihotivorum]|uniref:MPN domain-containing protein n=1 Tax=Clostridium manihotivorum TaxID=2320868 RepID=A0A3R5X0T8_9CLOT|nr:DNA repair protein RadC [Clostridium manihotivorum]QAA31501.1 hypothetical protein C1I91_07545 [Clostridium manihotivorum]